MKTISAALGCAGLAMLLASPTYAQTTTTKTTGAAPAVTTSEQATAANGSLEKYHDKWRASKLVGSSVYNDNGQSIGSIDDLMIGDDGKIADAVVSVGGFLGIGGKLVSVPFDQFKFEESRRSTAAASNETTTMPPAAVATTTTPPAAPAAPAATTTRTPAATNRAMPAEPIYYSIVLPNATKDSLTAAAGFKYTS